MITPDCFQGLIHGQRALIVGNRALKVAGSNKNMGGHMNDMAGNGHRRFECVGGNQRALRLVGGFNKVYVKVEHPRVVYPCRDDAF